MNGEDPLLNVRDTARLLKVHENTVRNWAKSGELRDERIPGSRYLRFRQSDVERLQKQRGSSVPSLKADRLALNPELATANEIKNWRTSGSRDAQQFLPELVRRLLVETPGVTRISVRTGDGVAAGGWDGLAESDGSAGFLPRGHLGIEIGVQQGIRAKADDDYEKRRDAGNCRGTIFVFITSSRWAAKEEWATERRQEGAFDDVAVIDADDLEGWLKTAPATHHWFSEHLQLNPKAAETIERFWRRLSESTTVILPLGLFVAGRTDQAVALRERLHASAPSFTTIESEWSSDVLAFVHAAVSGDADEEDPLSPVLIIKDSNVWSRVIGQPGSATLIGAFESPDVRAALAKGHHVISVLDRSAVLGRSADIKLPRIGRRAAAAAFEPIVKDFRLADRYAVLGRRSLPAMQRSIATNPKRRRPDWIGDERGPVIALAALTGSWVESEADLEALERLVGSDWPTIEKVIGSTRFTEDPLFRRIGNVWLATSPEEVFELTGELLNESLISRWVEQARAVLLDPDPILDLTPDERLGAQIRGERAALSAAVKRGVADGLAILGSRGTELRLSNGSTLEQFVSRAIGAWFTAANDDESGQKWRLLSPYLPRLAEAAPDALLEAVDDDLRRASPTLLSLFRGSDDVSILGSSSYHHHLLWALETLSWSTDLLNDCVRALARLTELDPGGKSANRPSNSMATVLCGWVRNTSAGTDAKLRALDAVFAVSDDVGWKLLIALWPDQRGFVIPPSTPKYRVGWVPASSGVLMKDWADFVHGLIDRALTTAANDPDRLASLAEELNAVAPNDREAILNRLEEVAHNDVFAADGQLMLWERVQALAANHRRFPDADWSMPTEVLDRLEKIADAIRPRDDPRRFAYLFDWRPDLPDVDEGNYSAYDAKLAELRAEAITAIMQRTDGLDVLADFAQRAKSPQALGWAMGDQPTITLDDLIPWLASDPSGLKQAAASFVGRRLRSATQEDLRAMLALPTLRGEARATFIRCIPPIGRFWGILDDAADDATTFWSTAPIDVVPPSDVTTAIDRLVQNDRAWTAIAVASYALSQKDEAGSPDVRVSPSDIVELLNVALTQRPNSGEIGQMTGFYLGELLDHLVEQGVADDVVAGLEYRYYRLLDHHRSPTKLKLALAAQPELFVQLVVAMTRGKDEPRREKTEDEGAAAGQAWTVLHGWTGCPGLQPDGTISETTLKDWITAARMQLSELDREDIGDELIGEAFGHSPIGTDGVWPAESVRRVIETIGSRDFERGLAIGRYNSRGITSRDPYEGGTQERSLAATYRQWSTALKTDSPRTSRVLRDIADSYERDAHREDVEAELDSDGL